MELVRRGRPSTSPWARQTDDFDVRYWIGHARSQLSFLDSERRLENSREHLRRGELTVGGENGCCNCQPEYAADHA
jgi:hypothetical protein